MSWDIELVSTLDGHEICVVENVNYTHNCNQMIRDAGFEEWPRVDGMRCEEFCSKLAPALTTLRRNPAKYRAMDPENGWGSYDSLLPVLTEIHDRFDRFPSGIVRCSY